MIDQTYNIHESYAWNYAQGPRFITSPPRCLPAPPKLFLGKTVRSRLGIAAGLLLNAKWVLGYAERGFDILTYKTVRSSARPSYDPPNWVFVGESQGDGPVIAIEEPPRDPAQISSAVCFGMPSMAPAVWREDVRQTRLALAADQLLIVSVVASPGEDWTLDQVSADFCQCARWAAEAGADAVEANFSCPNVCSAEGTVYLDPVATQTIAADLRHALGKTPLLIKTGHFPEEKGLHRFLEAVNGIAQGVTMVNCITRPVLRPDGTPVFGRSFFKAGVIGRAIHQPSVDAVRRAVTMVRDNRMNLSIVAVGGASRVEDLADFFDAGATAVLMGSSPMYLPDLAAEAKRQHPEW
jgi:dihydroorotate dehydrogenase (NAD+) catalytic subunit